MPVTLDEVYEAAESLMAIPEDVPDHAVVAAVMGQMPAMLTTIRIMVDVLRETKKRGADAAAAGRILRTVDEEVGKILGDDLRRLRS